jgi:hypothetical protein
MKNDDDDDEWNAAPPGTGDWTLLDNWRINIVIH